LDLVHIRRLKLTILKNQNNISIATSSPFARNRIKEARSQIILEELTIFGTI
jgi:hypothetical protein